ncbi:hypothetical protein [Prolixibacter bellariivorans]|uniref:hypothetical protein n=1 Tax=Prolixibacter bellariivorans TaxID=314319 RepID=UPI00046F5C47|nr:hypothetical protein [Prolixibacter bellariivorans]
MPWYFKILVTRVGVHLRRCQVGKWFDGETPDKVRNLSGQEAKYGNEVVGFLFLTLSGALHADRSTVSY